MGRPPKTDPTSRPAWAQRLSAAMRSAGLTTATLAKAVSKSDSAVGEWMTGESEPKFADVRKVALAVGKSPGWIVFGEGDPDENSQWGPRFTRHQNNPLFGLTFSELARMLPDEGLKADFAYLIEYTAKVLEAVERTKGQRGAEEVLRETLDIERAEIRREVDELRKKRI